MDKADFTEVCSTSHVIRIPASFHQQLVKDHNGRYKYSSSSSACVAFASVADMVAFESDLRRLSTPIREVKRNESFVRRVLKFLGVKK